MALSSAQLAFCEAWCEKHVTTWQIFRKGEWKYQWHGKTLVRYVDAVQVRVEEMSALLKYLASDACVSTLALNKQGIDGAWKPVNAWYEVNQKPNGALGGVRLYHALMIHPENGGDGPYVVENGCMWKVSWTFYWKQQSVAALPASSSGVNYRITNLNRDDENGTFSYVLERRERVQQDIAEYETAKTSFETRTEEQHLGVKQDRVASTGKAASVSNGKTVRRKLRKNEDCTTDVINESTEEVAVQGAVTETSSRLRGTETVTVNRSMPAKANESNLPVGTSVRNEKTEGGRWTQTIREFAASVAGRLRAVCRKTVFRHTHSQTTNMENDPGFTHVENAGGGVIRETDVQKTEYDTFDVTESVTTDIPARGAVTETRRYLDGTVTRTVNRNQAVKADETGLEVGDSVRNEKTESGLWDQTIERAGVEPAGRTGEICEQHALAHTHATTDGTGRTPPQTVEVTATTGSVVTRRARKTERGAWEVTDETRTAKPASKVTEGGSVGRTTTTTVYRNAPSIPAGAGGVNVEVDASVTPNEYGLVDGTVRRTVHLEQTETARSGTMLADEERTAKTDTLDASLFVPQRGVIYDASAQPNGMGAKNMTVVKRTAKPAIEELSWTDTHKTATRTTVYRKRKIIFRNQEHVPDFSGWEVCSPEVSINEFGLLDGVLTLQQLESDIASGSGGTGGLQYDMHFNVETFKYCIHKGKYYRKRFSADERHLVSTMQNMRAEVWRGKKRPDLGWVSQFEPDGSATIYSNIQEEGWKKIQELPRGETAEEQ